MTLKIVRHPHDEGFTAEFPTYRSNAFTHVHVTINDCEYELSDKPNGMSQTTFIYYAIGFAVATHNQHKNRADIRPLEISWKVSGYPHN